MSAFNQPPRVHRLAPAGQAPASSFHRPPSSSCRYQTLTSKSPEKGHLKHDVLPSKGRAPTPTAEPALPLFSRPRRPAAREGRGPGLQTPAPRTAPGRPGRFLTQGSEPRTPTQDTGPDPDSVLKIPDPDPGPGTRTADPDPDPRPPTRTPTSDPKR